MGKRSHAVSDQAADRRSNLVRNKARGNRANLLGGESKALFVRKAIKTPKQIDQEAKRDGTYEDDAALFLRGHSKARLDAPVVASHTPDGWKPAHLRDRPVNANQIVWNRANVQTVSRSASRRPRRRDRERNRYFS